MCLSLSKRTRYNVVLKMSCQGQHTCTLKGFDLQYIRGVLFGQISAFAIRSSELEDCKSYPIKYPKRKYNTLRLIEKKSYEHAINFAPSHTILRRIFLSFQVWHNMNKNITTTIAEQKKIPMKAQKSGTQKPYFQDTLKQLFAAHAANLILFHFLRDDER